jgi:hypothetical protein
MSTTYEVPSYEVMNDDKSRKVTVTNVMGDRWNPFQVKLSLVFIKHHAKKTNRALQVQLHSFLTSAQQ